MRAKYFLLSLLILIFAFFTPFRNQRFLNGFSFAQEPEEIEECKTRQECEELLKEYEAKISQYEKEISETSQKSKTLKNQIALLKKGIEKLNLQIRQSNAIIKELGIQISDTEKSIDKTVLEIENSKKNLTNILRAIYREDQKSDLEILLSGDKLSDFFSHLSDLESLNLKNQEILNNIEISKNLLEDQKRSSEEDKGDLENMVKLQMLQRKENESAKKENDSVLKLNEVQYQKYRKEKEEAEKKAAEIRAKIWELIGVREAPKYEEAVEVAKYVSGITDVRAAFLLGILTQESNIGKDVGQCYLLPEGKQTGMGVRFKINKKWPRVMKPSWVSLFLKTVEELNEKKNLNLDPFATQVSCWIPACVNKSYGVYQGSKYVSIDAEGNISCNCSNCLPFGWGGAMGPAQLMPFNWSGTDKYKAKIEAITGKVADPWDFSDSTLGAALHLKDCGAEVSERQAAACYFGGAGNKNTSYHLRVYADPVLRISKCHQEFIDQGTMSSACEAIIF